MHYNTDQHNREFLGSHENLPHEQYVLRYRSHRVLYHNREMAPLIVNFEATEKDVVHE